MPSPRVQRDIERLLDAASDALAENDWSVAVQRANAVLALDPDNEDAAHYLGAAERGQETGPSTVAPTASVAVTASPEPVGSSDAPESFADGRYMVDSFLGEGGKKRVYLCRDTTLDRDVAFALIKAEGLDEAGCQRVTREAQAMVICPLKTDPALGFWNLTLTPYPRHLKGYFPGFIQLLWLLLVGPSRTGSDPSVPVRYVAAHCCTPAARIQPFPLHPPVIRTSSRSSTPDGPGR
jgi:hypothetical protein